MKEPISLCLNPNVISSVLPFYNQSCIIVCRTITSPGFPSCHGRSLVPAPLLPSFPWNPNKDWSLDFGSRMKKFVLKFDIKDIRTLMTIIAIVVRMVILFYILEVLVVFLATHRVAYLPQAPGTSLDDGARKTNTQIWPS